MFGLSPVHRHTCRGATQHRLAVMYLARSWRRATRRLFNRPQHPYTQHSVAAVPIRTARERARRRIVLEGDIPNRGRPPSAAASFFTRCLSSARNS